MTDYSTDILDTESGVHASIHVVRECRHCHGDGEIHVVNRYGVDSDRYEVMSTEPCATCRSLGSLSIPLYEATDDEVAYVEKQIYERYREARRELQVSEALVSTVRLEQQKRGVT